MLRHILSPGGVTVFTKRVMQYLLTHQDGIEYHLLYSEEPQREVLASLPATHVVLAEPARLRWDQVTAPRYAEQQGLSLLFKPKFSVPMLSRVPTLIVIPGREQLAWRTSSPGTTAGTTAPASRPSAAAPPRSSPTRRSARRTAR